MVTVVPARYDHLPTVQLLFARLVAERGEAYPVIDDEELRKFLLMMSDRIDRGHDRDCCLVAELDGKLHGFTSLMIADRLIGKPNRFAFMEWIGVVPGSRRLGVGRLLVEAAVAWAEERGATVIEGNVSPSGGWAAGAVDYARRQVCTVAEAKASVLVRKEERPPVGASVLREEFAALAEKAEAGAPGLLVGGPDAPEPAPRTKRKKRAKKPSRLNGATHEAVP